MNVQQQHAIKSNAIALWAYILQSNSLHNHSARTVFCWTVNVLIFGVPTLNFTQFVLLHNASASLGALCSMNCRFLTFKACATQLLFYEWYCNILISHLLLLRKHQTFTAELKHFNDLAVQLLRLKSWWVNAMYYFNRIGEKL